MESETRFYGGVGELNVSYLQWRGVLCLLVLICVCDVFKKAMRIYLRKVENGGGLNVDMNFG